MERGREQTGMSREGRRMMEKVLENTVRDNQMKMKIPSRAAHRNRTIRVVRYSCKGTRNVPLGFESQKLMAVRTTAVNHNEP